MVRREGPPQASTAPLGGSVLHEVNSVGANTPSGDAGCWCIQLPRVMLVPPPPANAGQPDNNAASCFCPACLKQITDERQNAISAADD